MRTPIFSVVNTRGHTPLPLGMIQAYFEGRKSDELAKKCQFYPLVDLASEEVAKIALRFGPGIWLFSNYLWSLDENLNLSRVVKEVDSRNITIHGGPSTPKYPEANEVFFRSNSHVDLTVRGEGEITAVELLDCLIANWHKSHPPLHAMSGIEGISFRFQDRIVRNADRPRITDLDKLPSPYLDGIFDTYVEGISAAILETNRGCPYRCSFCDWGSLTNQKIRRFSLDRVFAEIDWIAQHRIQHLWLADANFGIFERDIEIARHIASAKEKYGYPFEVIVNYAKNGSRRLAEIIKVFTDAEIISQGIISIQTTDEPTLEIIGRQNIKSEKYDELTEIFTAEKLPLATDLMIGLPGSTMESFKKDLQKFFDDDITVKAYRTRVLPNSPMADPAYLGKHDVVVDDHLQIQSTFSFSADDLSRMMNYFVLYRICDIFAVTKYIMCYLQWDYGILATDFVQVLMDHMIRYKKALVPRFFATLKENRALDTALSLKYYDASVGWEGFYDAISEFCEVNFPVRMDEAFLTVRKVNEAVMPHPGKGYPLSVPLEHDFVAYYKDQRKSKGSSAPLASYTSGKLIVDDPHSLSEWTKREGRQYDIHQIFWELDSPLRRNALWPGYATHPPVIKQHP